VVKNKPQDKKKWFDTLMRKIGGRIITITY